MDFEPRLQVFPKQWRILLWPPLPMSYQHEHPQCHAGWDINAAQDDCSDNGLRSQTDGHRKRKGDDWGILGPGEPGYCRQLPHGIEIPTERYENDTSGLFQNPAISPQPTCADPLSSESVGWAVARPASVRDLCRRKDSGTFSVPHAESPSCSATRQVAPPLSAQQSGRRAAQIRS